MSRVAALLVVCAVALSGCVKITGQTRVQRETIGDVVVTTTFCESSASGSCPQGDTNSNESGEVFASQLLVAYRVPAAVVPPAQISAVYLAPESGSTLLARSTSYTSELQSKAPAVAGEKWVGYLSPVVSVADQKENARFTVTAEFGLARGPTGAPFVGPFRYRTVAGARALDDVHPGTEPVECSADVTQQHENTDTNTLTYCVDTPKGAESVIATDGQTLATRDLGVLNGPSATVVAGHTGSIAFKIRSVGMNGSPVFDLSAGTTVPGGSATPSQSVFAPSPADATMPVSVAVPKATPPGNYRVTLNAALGNSQLRTGTGTLRVRPRPTKPELSLSVKKRKLGAALKRGLKVRVRCDRACGIKVRLGRYGGGKGRLDAAGRKTVVAKFKRSARRRLKHKRSVRFKLRVTATGANGLRSTTTRRVKLRR